VINLDSAKEWVTRKSIATSKGRGVWRYAMLLPNLNPRATVSLGEGTTNLLRSNHLAEVLGLRHLYVKDETSNPSGSFIDRGTTVDISRANALGFKMAACGWSGNLASSVAAYCARAGIKARTYLPGEIDLGKLYQIVAYGAEISPCESREHASELLMADVDSCYPVTPQNPYFLEGMKTTGIEIADQLDWRPPDWIVVPMGNGSHISMIHKALREMEYLGIADGGNTKLVGVQVEGCSPIADRMRMSRRTKTPSGRTFARDIAISSPAMADDAIAAIKDTAGCATVVSEREILDAVKMLAKNEGIFAEPASASTIAGLRSLLESKEISRAESVVCVVTGIGLKDPTIARKMASKNRTARRMLSRYEHEPGARRIGDSKLTILKILNDGDDYAYSIRGKLAERTGREVTLVSVYQHLLELKDMGLISLEGHVRSPQRRVRVYYSVTEAGREFLETPPGEG